MGLIPGLEDPLEKEMATHSSILAWEIPWTEEPGGLQSMGSQNNKIKSFIYYLLNFKSIYTSLPISPIPFHLPLATTRACIY